MALHPLFVITVESQSEVKYIFSNREENFDGKLKILK